MDLRWSWPAEQIAESGALSLSDHMAEPADRRGVMTAYPCHSLHQNTHIPTSRLSPTLTLSCLNLCRFSAMSGSNPFRRSKIIAAAETVPAIPNDNTIAKNNTAVQPATFEGMFHQFIG